MSPIIQINQLSKHFTINHRPKGRFSALRSLVAPVKKIVKAVNEITFEIERGELVGYLGPNGAGKSTTLKMLTGLLVPTSGKLEVNGYLPWRDRQNYVSQIGAVFGQRTTLWWDLPTIESLEMLQHIYKIPAKKFQTNLNAFRELLELDNFIHTPVRSLSLGQRMRADLCAALLHDPALLFLDEPTIGLDVVAKDRIRQFIQYIHQEKHTTIILTTHDLSDVEKLCNRVMIIDEGRLLFDGQLDTLKDRFGGKRQLIVDFTDEYEDPRISGADIVTQQGSRVAYSFARNQQTASELIGKLTSRYRIRDLEVKEPDIEETIRKIYEDRLLSKHAPKDDK